MKILFHVEKYDEWILFPVIVVAYNKSLRELDIELGLWSYSLCFKFKKDE